MMKFGYTVYILIGKSISRSRPTILSLKSIDTSRAGQAAGGSFKPEKAISQRKNLPIVTSGEMSCDVVTMKW